ncbi:methyltransferase type 11 [Acidocella aquatica]|uniref:Methyltransferase type 11 n=1 Tax=Acidocella aquatica TaxID=1922313 RepID=A0ABQ5ZZA9_9PROT|nr:methyltransferase domain-containing protein [Acidocella aquatica]GLR65560.1 methyltransferase type 11 [Acidocella aquatica]
MATDTRDAAGFYATALGQMTAALLRRKLLALWPDCTGMSVLGLGYTGPYLHLWREQARRCIAVSPPQLGLAPWPAGRANLACSAEEDALPFPDLMFDRILLVHGLEQAGNARRCLREVWRLLKDDGQLIIVAPNRRGLWAYAESTPFGHGQPYSEAQITRLLQGLFFRVEAEETCLFAPPLNWGPALRVFNMCERTGRLLAPQFAGLHVVAASKDLHGLIPARHRAAGRRVLVDAGR